MLELWSWYYFSRYPKFYVDFKNSIRLQTKIIGFEDNFVSVCCENFSQLWQEYTNQFVWY